MKKINKKGSIRDYFLFLGVLFFLVISLFVAYRTYSSIATALKSTDIGNDTVAVQAIDHVQNVINRVDYFFMLAFIFTLIGMLVSSFLVDFHPIFYVVFVLSWVLGVVLGAIISNVYQNIIIYDYFTTLPFVMPFANYIFSNLAMVMTLVGFLLSAVMFVRIRSGQFSTR